MTAGVLVCARCDYAILPGEAYITLNHERMSGPPVVSHVHKDPCPKR